MKKLTLLTAALVSAAAMTGAPLTAQAAGRTVGQPIASNKNIIVIGGNNLSCDLQSVIQNLKDCFPNLNIPGIPVPDRPDNSLPIPPDGQIPDMNLPDQGIPDEKPDNNKPDSNIPDNKPDNTPDNNQPDIKPDNKPDNNQPDIKPDNKPDNNQPDNKPNNKPDNNQPDNKPDNKPDNNKPSNKPENNKPNNKPDSNKPGQDTPDEETPGGSGQLTYAEEVVRLVNEERAKRGLSALTIKENIRAAAQVRAKEIQSSFSHTRPDGTSFSTALTQQNVSFRGAGENIAWGQRTPAEVMDAWMNSDGHRANILNKSFTSIGVSYVVNNGVGYWVQLFTY